jgi:predicted molibdopterin-dependent oxidoreductase YjgC
VVLPVVSFGEEQVTFTSAERRVQLTAKAIEPPSGLLPAWAQIVRVARRMGAPWEYGSSADVMDEIRQAVPEYGATSYENLAREYGRQWPCTPDKPLGTRFLFEDGLPDRGFSFAPMERPAAFAQPPEGFPLTLVLGHSLYYWNRNVLIQHSETLKREYGILLLDYPEGFVEISVEDADRLGVRDGKPVRLLTDIGSATSAARVTDEVRPGMVFVPFFLQEVAQQLLGEPRIGGPARTAFVRVERA